MTEPIDAPSRVKIEHSFVCPAGHPVRVPGFNTGRSWCRTCDSFEVAELSPETKAAIVAMIKEAQAAGILDEPLEKVRETNI
jgi:hypothetical protein